MKKITVLGVMGYFVFLFCLSGCISTPSLVGIGCDIGSTLLSISKNATKKSNYQQNTFIGELIEQHAIGQNTVKINKATFNSESGIFFIAYDANGKQIGDVFYEANNEDDMRDYSKFSKMNSTEKKQYIHEDFIQYANVDLGPIEPETVETVTYKTPATPVSAPDIPISSFAPTITSY